MQAYRLYKTEFKRLKTGSEQRLETDEDLRYLDLECNNCKRVKRPEVTLCG